MTRGKVQGDAGSPGRTSQYTDSEWEQKKLRLKQKLRHLYPDPIATADPPWDHPSDVWVNWLVSEVDDAISTVRHLKTRYPAADLEAEQQSLLKQVIGTEIALRSMSQDLLVRLPLEADVLAVADALHSLLPHLEALAERIERLPRSQKRAEVQHQEAIALAVVCLRSLKQERRTIAATADKDLSREFLADRFLKIVGDEFGLVFDERTWKDVITTVRDKV